MDAKILQPKKIIAWADTLRSMLPGREYFLEASYKDTGSIRSKASQLRSEGMAFTVRKVDENITSVKRIK